MLIALFCSVSHKDLADNVFMSMDGGLSPSSDKEEEEKFGSCDDQQAPDEVERDPENSSVAQSDDELASNLSENVDEASIDEEGNDHDDNDGDAEADVGGGNDDNANSDVESASDDNYDDIASNISGKLPYACLLCLCFSCFTIN